MLLHRYCHWCRNRVDTPERGAIPFREPLPLFRLVEEKKKGFPRNPLVYCFLSCVRSESSRNEQKSVPSLPSQAVIRSCDLNSAPVLHPPCGVRTGKLPTRSHGRSDTRSMSPVTCAEREKSSATVYGQVSRLHRQVHRNSALPVGRVAVTMRCLRKNVL